MLRIFNLKDNLGRIYMILPYIGLVQNKASLVFSILTSAKYKLMIGNYTTYFKDHQFSSLLYLLGAISFADSFQIRTNGIVTMNINNNKFEFSIKNPTLEESNMVELIFSATRFGADLITNDQDETLRKKSFKIYNKNNKKIIETSTGIKFFVESMNPGNTIVETFVNEIHDINSKINFKDKVVIDIGAECGDTALYFAQKGATVYAIEPMKAHYKAMIHNLELNPEISKKIIPINCAIGKDEILKFYHDRNNEIGEAASFVYNTHKENSIVTEVKGYTLETFLKEQNLDKVELIKIDCKGCEFFLSNNDIDKTNIIKIEYNTKMANRNLSELLLILEKSGFTYTSYKHSIFDRASMKERGTLVGIKKYKIKKSLGSSD